MTAATCRLAAAGDVVEQPEATWLAPADWPTARRQRPRTKRLVVLLHPLQHGLHIHAPAGQPFAGASR
jgi:hypothetical protein